MAYPPISALPTAPDRTQPSTFSTRADAFVAALATFRTELNTAGDYIDGIGTSVDSDKTAAEAAQTAAEAAQGLAETAQSLAEAAQTAAEAAQTAAETAQTNAETAETGAETALTNFEKSYLGAKATPPSVDNEGGALQTGALYYDTTDDALKIYDGGWQAAAFEIDSAGALIAANNLSDLTSVATARSNLGLVIDTDVQAYDAGLADIAGVTPTNGVFLVGDGANWVGESGATVRASLGLEIGVDVQAYDATILVSSDIGSTVQGYDADTLKSDTTAALTVGYTEAVYDAGTKSSGTFTPDPALRGRQKIVNGGAFTLAKPSSDCNMVILITNNASAGTITFSGFVSGFPKGDDLDTTDTNKFKLYIDVTDGNGTCRVEALQ